MRLYWEGHGEVTALREKAGRRAVLDDWHMEALVRFLNDRPTAFLDEMARFLFDEWEVIFDEATIWRALRRRGWSRKQSSKVAKERNAALRADWALRLTNWTADQLVFIDESAGNERTGYRKYAWGPVGSPSYSVESIKRSKRWSVLPAFSTDGYIAHRIHHGSITAEIFDDFIRYDVLPLCSTDGIEPRSVIVMDNARIHRNAELQIMCAETNVLLAYLPPYSPDYNPIETSFAILKAWVKRNMGLAASYTEAMGEFEAFPEDAVVTVQQVYLTAKGGGKRDPGNLFRLAGIEYP